MNTRTRAPVVLPWLVEEMPFDQIDKGKVVADRELFFLLAGASFIETASDVYTRNLVEYFPGDDEVAEWLSNHWEPEEVQHGRALRAYVSNVWPDFDWDHSYHGFAEEYVARCTLDEFEPSQGLEMAARCVVETGTATFYRALYDSTEEPVLKRLLGHIKSDEVRHYKYFYRYFKKYNEDEKNGNLGVGRAVLKRLWEARSDDAEIALRHLFKERFPARSTVREAFQDVATRVNSRVRDTYPYRMGIEMLLKPVAIPGPVKGAAYYVLERAARRFLFR